MGGMDRVRPVSRGSVEYAVAATRGTRAICESPNLRKPPNNRLRMFGRLRQNCGYTGVSRFLADRHAGMPIAA